jgi:hypothetical protein
MTVSTDPVAGHAGTVVMAGVRDSDTMSLLSSIINCSVFSDVHISDDFIVRVPLTSLIEKRMSTAFVTIA